MSKIKKNIKNFQLKNFSMFKAQTPLFIAWASVRIEYVIKACYRSLLRRKEPLDNIKLINEKAVLGLKQSSCAKYVMVFCSLQKEQPRERI